MRKRQPAITNGLNLRKCLKTLLNALFVSCLFLSACDNPIVTEKVSVGLEVSTKSGNFYGIDSVTVIDNIITSWKDGKIYVRNTGDWIVTIKIIKKDE